MSSVPPAARRMAYCLGHEAWVWDGDPAHAYCVRVPSSPAASRLRSSTTGAGSAARPPARIVTGFAPLDTIMGGGCARGSSATLCGDPGTGKSTLLAEALGHYFSRGGRPLYAVGEESRAQVDARARRVGAGWRVLATQEWPEVEREFAALVARRATPGVVVVDSAQAFGDSARGLVPGTVPTVRALGPRMVALAKQGAFVVLVVQITKDGRIAGPKALEHLVDATLEIRHGDAGARVLTATKNRNGQAPASVALRMTPAGLVEADAARPPRRPGQAWAVVGRTSPALARVDAVVTSGRRGVEVEGLPVARARRVVEALARVIPALAKARVTVSAESGVADDPAADLAIAAAIVSALENVSAEGLAWAGAVGVTGEVEPPDALEARAARVARAGARLVVGEAPGLPVGVGSVGDVGEVVEALRGASGTPRGALVPPSSRVSRAADGGASETAVAPSDTD